MVKSTRLSNALALLGLLPLMAGAASPNEVTPAPTAAAPAAATAAPKAAAARAPAAKVAHLPEPAARPARKSRYPLGAMPEGARNYYADVYGIDQMTAKLTESGALVRFSYRVVDARKAKVMMDRAAEPTMLDEAAHAALSIPVMDKVGPLRQSMAAVEGRSYWMTFSNKGSPVKPGHRVSVAVGPVRVDGLIVE